MKSGVKLQGLFVEASNEKSRQIRAEAARLLPLLIYLINRKSFSGKLIREVAPTFYVPKKNQRVLWHLSQGILGIKATDYRGYI